MGVGSLFHVLRSRTHFRRYRVRRVPFSCFALPYSFSAVSRASRPVFMFCVPGLVFGAIEGVGTRFLFLRSRTHFRQYRGRRVPFSCFARPDAFSAVPWASGLVFMFCKPRLVFGGTVGVGSRFHFLRPRTRFRVFKLSNSFSAVPSASGPVFMFSAPGLFSGGTEVVRSRFHVFRSRTCFWGYRGRSALFHVLRTRTHFRRYRRRRVQFSSFARPDSFLALVGVGSRFHVLLARTRFRRYRGQRVPFSCIALPDTFSAIPMASAPVFMFRSRTHFRRY
jgi:hypothetical protein